MLHVVGRHEHIGVGQNDPVIFGGPPSLDAVVQLRIGAYAVIAHQNAGSNLGMGSHCFFDPADNRIPLLGNTEDQLVMGPVELKGARQGQCREVFDPADGDDDRNRRPIGDAGSLCAAGRQPPHCYGQADQVDKQEGCCGEGEVIFCGFR